MEIYVENHRVRPLHLQDQLTEMAQPDLLQVAEKAFSEATSYHKARSGYQLQTIQLFLEKIGFPKVSSTPNSDELPITLLELAAGTGQFTKPLVEAIKSTSIQRFIASEPLDGMRKVLQDNCPGVDFRNFRAEQIHLPDASVHAVVVANAIHYFTTPETFAEICRVLVPGGVIGIFHKGPNFDIEPWTLEMIKDAAKWYQHAGVCCHVDDIVGWGPVLNESGLFHKVEKATAVEYDPMNEEEALQYMLSFGAFAVCSRSQKDELRERYQKVIHDNYSGVGRKMTALPFKSSMFWAKKK